MIGHVPRGNALLDHRMDVAASQHSRSPRRDALTVVERAVNLLKQRR